MKKLRRIIAWIIINSGNAILAYAWLINHNPYAENVFKFIFWGTVLWLMMLSCSDRAKDALTKAGRSVPAFFTYSFDLSLTLFLVAFGHFIMAAAWIIQILCEVYLFSDLSPTKTAETKE